MEAGRWGGSAAAATKPAPDDERGLGGWWFHRVLCMIM